MHPILSRRGRLLGYLLLWVTFGGLLAGQLNAGLIFRAVLRNDNGQITGRK